MAGSGLCTLLTAWAPGAREIALLQGLAGMFLSAEMVLALVHVAEEFPRERRSLAIGILQGARSLGMFACAAVAPAAIGSGFGWRGLFMAGMVPMFLSVVALVFHRETRRLVAVSVEAARERSPLLRIWRSSCRNRLLIIGTAWCAVFACTRSSVMFWKEFAVAERGFTDAQVAAPSPRWLPRRWSSGWVTSEIHGSLLNTRLTVPGEVFAIAAMCVEVIVG